MSQTKAKLKPSPCPFCGEADLLHVSAAPPGGAEEELEYYAWCIVCEGTGPMAESKEEAVRRWNRRGHQ